MSLLDYFKGKKNKSASVAKERLQIIVAHERGQRDMPDYLPQLQQELLQVIPSTFRSATTWYRWRWIAMTTAPCWN